MKKMRELKQKIKSNKPLYITLKLFKVLCTIFLIFVLIVILVQKFFNNKSIAGYRVFSIASESMKTDYSIGDIIVVKEEDASDLKVGDDVTYLGNKGNLSGLMITHRIISIRKEGNDYFYTTKGTSNLAEDPEISYSQIYGKVFYKTVVFSYIGRLMSNIYSYYVLSTLVVIYVSYQIVKAKFDDEDNDDEDEEEEDSDNS